MREHIKKHDLRDEIYAPKTSVKPMPDDPLYDEAKVIDDTNQLATPDKPAVEGQNSHM